MPRKIRFENIQAAKLHLSHKLFHKKVFKRARKSVPMSVPVVTGVSRCNPARPLVWAYRSRLEIAEKRGITYYRVINLQIIA